MNTQTQIRGLKECPNWLRLKYLSAVNYMCQRCGSKRNLQIHRIIRGNQNGLYTLYPLNHELNNIKVFCSDCHRLIHSMEKGVTK